MTTLEIAWVAGLLEGEGCFSLSDRSKRLKPCSNQILITLGMTDKDVVERAARLFNTNVYHRDRPNGWKTCYSTTLTGAKAAGWMMTILPFLGSRRKARVLECLEFWKTKCPTKKVKHGEGSE